MLSMRIISASSIEYCTCISFAAATGDGSTTFDNNTSMGSGSRSAKLAHLTRYSGRTLATRGNSGRWEDVVFGQCQSFWSSWEYIVFFKWNKSKTAIRMLSYPILTVLKSSPRMKPGMISRKLEAWGWVSCTATVWLNTATILRAQSKVSRCTRQPQDNLTKWSTVTSGTLTTPAQEVLASQPRSRWSLSTT